MLGNREKKCPNSVIKQKKKEGSWSDYRCQVPHNVEKNECQSHLSVSANPDSVHLLSWWRSRSSSWWGCEILWFSWVHRAHPSTKLLAGVSNTLGNIQAPILPGIERLYLQRRFNHVDLEVVVPCHYVSRTKSSYVTCDQLITVLQWELVAFICGASMKIIFSVLFRFFFLTSNSPFLNFSKISYSWDSPSPLILLLFTNSLNVYEQASVSCSVGILIYMNIFPVFRGHFLK